MYANNEIGTIQPVAELAKVAHRHGALFHSDCTQALGKIPVDVAALGVDIATFSGHKIGAPKGIGCAYIRKGVEIAPLLRGGHQERRLRAGTENTLGIIAFGVAANLARSTPAQYAQDIAPLRDHLRDAITKRLDRIAINGYQTSLLPNTLNISFASAEGESIMLYLDQEGITVGTGSACASADGKPSHVIMALRPDPELAHGSIRFSLGFDTTRADIDRVAAVLPPIIEKLRGISTV
jgi:cysteine desulfurase